MNVRKTSDAVRNKRRRRVEVIGLPGSGKSTLIKNVVAGDKRIQDQNDLVKAAALYWLSQRSRLGKLLARSFLGEVAKQKYYASEVTSRSYLRENPEVAQGLSDWFARIEGDTGVQYIGRMIAINQTIKRAKLFDNFYSNRLTLLDEHWIQLLTIILNCSSDDEQFVEWFEGMLKLIPAPDGVIWLSGAYQVAEERQVQRGKMAVIFVGSLDILEKGMAIEQRMEMATAILQQSNIPVLKLSAVAPVLENRKIVHQWLQGNNLL